jgi:polysaccharide biosynthesis protein PslH
MATILTIIPYPIYPPVNGGALRCFYILREMARHHTVYLFTGQQIEDFKLDFEVEFPDNVHIISYSKESKYKSILNFLPSKTADALNFRYLTRSFHTSANSVLLESYSSLVKLLKKVKFDIVFYESLFALGLYGGIIKKEISSFHLYDAHNVDSILWTRLAIERKNKKFEKYAKEAQSLEKSLYKRVDAYFCCSDVDKEKLTRLNRNLLKGLVIPNGVDLKAKPFDKRLDKYLNKELIFCGSLDYLPNKEGILWFYKEILPLIKKSIPAIKLTIVGNSVDSNIFQEIKDNPSINFIGQVKSVVPYYKASAIAIVPLLTGSGTRLKILEAMSMGNPVVSTTVGAEGIDYIYDKHLLVGDTPEQFAEKVIWLLSDRQKFDDNRNAALELVRQKYDWELIGKITNYNIHKFISI